MGSGLDVAGGHRMSGRQRLRAQVSWVPGLGSSSTLPSEVAFHLLLRQNRPVCFLSLFRARF